MFLQMPFEMANEKDAMSLIKKHTHTRHLTGPSRGTSTGDCLAGRVTTRAFLDWKIFGKIAKAVFSITLLEYLERLL